ncbi:hypothetical protein Q8V93_003442 [Enterobacter asburiae]|nr:hypothetical protein [Enterobacter asburiae]
MYGGTDEAVFYTVINKFKNKISIGRMPLKYHRLPHEPQEYAVITIGISRDEKIRGECDEHIPPI